MRELRLEYPADPGPVEFVWRVQPGDEVHAGAVLAVASTDKATQEVEAFEAMRIHAITPTARGFVLVVEAWDESR